MQGGPSGRLSETFVGVSVSKGLKISSIVTCGMDWFTCGRHFIAYKTWEGAEGRHQNSVEDAWWDL